MSKPCPSSELDECQHGLLAMLDSLQSERLEVVLTPSRNRREAQMGGKIRCVMGQNPQWYQRFCAQHLSTRKRRNALPDTRIKRANVVALLERLCAGKTSRSYYLAEIVQVARSLPPPEDEPPF